ncbi:unnamed protein product [Ilex paraguariensis]|uniref:RING-type E3 ubiquitin transferase n=1 Tax=Ilex paraguariensis TaxID=185542 RepID=A0ABC8UL35_9AQUA
MTTDDKNSNSHAGLHRFTFTSNHAIIPLLLLLLLLLSPTVRSQSSPPEINNQYRYNNFSPSMAIIIVVLIAALFLMGFLSIYIRHCSNSSNGNSVRAVLSMRSRRAAAARGLDPSVIEKFPTFAYTEVKDRKIGKGALECAVCLNEFEDDETLRLIPKCDHVFHPECIDAWLTAHITCPVCRADLVAQPGESIHLPPQSQTEIDIENQATDEADVMANGNVSTSLSREQEKSGPMKRTLSMNQNRPPRSGYARPRLFGRFRSHSTGHSLVQPGENTDRFTLRLPVEVRKEVMDRAILNRTPSCATKVYRNGEGSGRGRSFKRLEILDRSSDRWAFSMAPPFFSRTSSVRSPKVGGDTGEESTSSSSSRMIKGRMIKMASFNCLDTKDYCGLVSADSAKPSV